MVSQPQFYVLTSPEDERIEEALKSGAGAVAGEGVEKGIEKIIQENPNEKIIVGTVSILGKLGLTDPFALKEIKDIIYDPTRSTLEIGGVIFDNVAQELITAGVTYYLRTVPAQLGVGGIIFTPSVPLVAVAGIAAGSYLLYSSFNKEFFGTDSTGKTTSLGDLILDNIFDETDVDVSVADTSGKLIGGAIFRSGINNKGEELEGVRAILAQSGKNFKTSDDTENQFPVLETGFSLRFGVTDPQTAFGNSSPSYGDIYTIFDTNFISTLAKVVGKTEDDVLTLGNNQDYIGNSADGKKLLAISEDDFLSIPVPIIKNGQITGTEIASYQGNQISYTDASGKLYSIVVTRIPNTFASDLIVGNSGDDNLAGSNGNSYIIGAEGNDFLRGGDGKDLLLGESGKDALQGGAGDDILVGGIENDLLAGDLLPPERGPFAGLGLSSVFNENVEQNAGSDILFGGPGDDELFGIFKRDTNTWVDDKKSDLLYGGTDADKFYVGNGDIVIDNPDPLDQVFRLSPTGLQKVEVSNNAVSLLGEFRLPAEQSSFSLAQDHFSYSENIGNLSGDYLADKEVTVIARPKPDYTNDPTIPDADEQFLDIIFNATGLSDEELTGERTPDVTNPVGLFYRPILQQQESYTTADGSPGTTTILRFKEGVALVDESSNAFYLRNEQGTPLTDGDFGLTFPGKDDLLIGDNGGYDQWQRDIIDDLKVGGLTKNEEKTWANIQYWLENTLFPNVVGYRQALVVGTPVENAGLTFYIENLDGSNRPIPYPGSNPDLTTANTLPSTGSTSNTDTLIPNPTPTAI